MNIDEIIDAFRRRAIDLDCKKMVLTQRKEGGERFEGPGCIRQTSDGVLTFKLYVVGTESADARSQLDARSKAVVGRLYTDDEYYDLTAVGYDGANWTAARIRAVFDWDMADQSVLAKGQLQSIVASLELPQRHHYLRLHFFEEYNVPLNLMSRAELHGAEYMVPDRAEFEAWGSNFEVRKREGSGDTVIEVTSDVEFPTAFHLRIQEALQYVTARVAIWRARLESKGDKLLLELASPWRTSPRTQLSPPISPASSDSHHHGWKLFAKYLAYVVAKTDGTHWNPVAYHLYNACEATANSVDAWAVGVSVAVEAVTHLIQMPGDGAKAERVSLFQERMRAYVAAQADFADLAPRMDGLITSMGNRRPHDKLYSLAETGHVERAYVDAWIYLRNRHVHPAPKDLREPDPVDYQTLLDKIHRVEVLLRQLTFYLIGYEGPFTDYGAEGFPSKHYPLAETAAASRDVAEGDTRIAAEGAAARHGEVPAKDPKSKDEADSPAKRQPGNATTAYAFGTVLGRRLKGLFRK